MLNITSLHDVTLDLLWNMVKSNWRWLVHWIWYEGLPMGLGLVAAGCTFFAVVLRINADVFHWYSAVGFLAANVAAFAVAVAVESVQSLALKAIGRPNIFKDWDKS